MKKALLFLSLNLILLTAYGQLKLKNDGNFGVGTLDPQEKLHVNGSVRGNQSGAIRINTGNGYVDIGPKSSSYCNIETDRAQFYFNKAFSLNVGLISAPNYSFKTSGYTYPRLIIYSNGYVGINKGQSSPQYNLDVSGNIRATGVVYESDERLKDEITTPEDEEIRKLIDLEAKKYKMKKPEYANPHKDDSKLHFGFIAQEFQKSYPELVYEDSNGYLSINYIEIIPLLVEELKSQNRRIEYLETKVKDLKLKNASSDVIEPSIDKNLLKQNVPNPFTEETRIEFYISENVSSAQLYIYDLQGKQVKSMTVAERYSGSAIIQGSELQPGMYKYALIADGKLIDTKTMVLTSY